MVVTLSQSISEGVDSRSKSHWVCFGRHGRLGGEPQTFISKHAFRPGAFRDKPWGQGDPLGYLGSTGEDFMSSLGGLLPHWVLTVNSPPQERWGRRWGRCPHLRCPLVVPAGRPDVHSLFLRARGCVRKRYRRSQRSSERELHTKQGPG